MYICIQTNNVVASCPLSLSATKQLRRDLWNYVCKRKATK